jgi:hypothetical protein
MRSSVRSRLAPPSLRPRQARLSSAFLSFRCDSSVSSSAKAPGVKEGRTALRGSLSSAFRIQGLPISDIVKRKRIRSRAGWGETMKPKGLLKTRRRKSRRVVILPFEQPVVGPQPDRSDSRMRLKQNWSFHAKKRVCDRLPIDRKQRTRALAMRAIKCLKGIWWMPWR